MFNWKINRIGTRDELITDVNYTVYCLDGENKVATEGNWTFSDQILKKPFSEVTEEDIVSWIEKESTQDNVCVIKSRLQEQMKALNDDKNAHFPWLPEVFTPKI